MDSKLVDERLATVAVEHKLTAVGISPQRLREREFKGARPPREGGVQFVSSR